MLITVYCNWNTVNLMLIVTVNFLNLGLVIRNSSCCYLGKTVILYII